MWQRDISFSDVKHVIESGEVIEQYTDDVPYPSKLLLGWRESRPLHVVVADNEDHKELIIVTVYEPSTDFWYDDFKRRKS